MGSPEEKTRHSKRLKYKKRERLESKIAKELITSGKFKQRIVKDKRGNKHDLENMSHAKLVQLINENQDDQD